MGTLLVLLILVSLHGTLASWIDPGPKDIDTENHHRYIGGGDLLFVTGWGVDPNDTLFVVRFNEIYNKLCVFLGHLIL